MFICNYVVIIIIILECVHCKKTTSFQPTCCRRTPYPTYISSRNKPSSCIPFATNLSYVIPTRYDNEKETKHRSENISPHKTQAYSEQEVDVRKAYVNAHITSKEEFKIRHHLDEVDELAKQSPKVGIEEYERIYAQYNSTRALFGIGRSSNILATNILKDLEDGDNKEMKKEELLDNIQKLHNQAIDSMCKILDIENVPIFLYLQAGKFCLELSNRMNLENKTIQALSILHTKYPAKFDYGFQLGLELLLQLQLDKAEVVLRGVIDTYKEINMIKALYLLGLCLKLQKYYKYPITQNDNEVNNLVEMALEKEDDSLKVFNMIGTKYNRNGKHKEAEVVFDEGVRIGLFLSKWQRSSSKKDFRLKHLRGMPIWTPKQTGYHKALVQLQRSYQVIRQEGLSALFGSDINFKEEAENLREEGLWQQLVLFETGVRSEKGCELAPRTCNLILKYMKEISADCTHGQVKFSVIHSGTHVWPHSGPSNCRLRSHLGLVIPEVSGDERLEIRIADKYAYWKEGEFLIIDDSFEHELWYEKQDGGIRLLLLIDMWHPDLTTDQRKNISPLVNRNQNHSTIFTVSGIVEKIPDNEN